MARYCVVLIAFTLFFKTAVSQKRDTAVYYVKNSGMLVSTKDSADYFLVVLPPDTTVDKNLFIIKSFYPNGKLKFMTGASTNILPLKFQGTYIEFYPSGHKRFIKNYDKGIETGDIIQFYPNGRFYCKKSFLKTATNESELLFKDCSDSTGKVLAENGNGNWVTYNIDFTRITEEGKIVNSLQDSIWKISPNNGVSYTRHYKNGEIDDKIFTSVEDVPEFPGGIDAFIKFLAKTIRYPAIAWENNIQGRVIISFVVEKDGSFTDVKVARDIGGGCGEEAARVMKLSPRWKPGMTNGKPVRVAYSVPINFTLDKQ
jgi:TonB family protein